MGDIQAQMADRDHVQTPEAELSAQVFSRGQPKCDRNTDMVRTYRTATDAGSAKEDKKEMGIFQHGLNGPDAPDELHSHLFAFMENPAQKLDKLATKPPDGQMALF